MVKLPCWDIFKKAVEGRDDPLSCTVEGGVFALIANSIESGAKPNLKLLADVLRSEMPIPQDIRNWLADMMDEDANSEMQFKELKRRRRGAGTICPAKHIDAAMYFETFMMEAKASENSIIDGEVINRKRAIEKTLGYFKIGKSTLEVAIQSLAELPSEDKTYMRNWRNFPESN